ncbi:FecR domain-containing protein [Flavivirga abyssicola]|uniref:FecR family protein n=1 Tax=Flavivirga abyssicola TaxID=3063533 RepID=UPI0026E0F3B5|nr:FecR family protein [Flavivirga sp. MEBiC07777]WVK12010.1 FecR domain-containing protein [Flavivirga sp. MEBiC07777]
MKSHITKLLTNTITEKELVELKDWLGNPKNQSKLEAYISDYHDLNLATLKNNIDDAYNKVLTQIENDDSKTISFYRKSIFKYAAAVFLFLSAGYFFIKNKDRVTDSKVVINNNIKIGTNKAVLTLENGTSIELEKGNDYISENVISNGKEIVYKNTNNTKPEIAYNYLTIPRGGEYFIKLADGTQIWLNSESQLKYPVNFIKGETRAVELVYGEAYFDVSPSENHNGDRFKVLNQGQEVEVLGTEFNIKAYKDETYIYTTLIEGKVTVANNQHKNFLNPGQQSILNTNTKKVEIIQVDTYSEIAWKRGLFSFKNKNLKDISKVLSRWYDVDFVFEDKSLEQIEFKGVLSKNQNIEEILILIKNTNFINAYDINNTTITLKN